MGLEMNVKSKKWILVVVSLMLFVDGLCYGLIFPILPSLFFDNKLGLLSDDQYLPKELLYSLTLSILFLASLLGMPILGILSDLYGRNRIIIMGIIGFVCAHLIGIISILIHNVWLFYIAIFLYGFCMGTYSVGSALISDISYNEDNRISNFKIPILSSMLGFIIGPGLSVFVDQINIPNPLIIPFVIVLMFHILNILFYLKILNTNKINESINLNDFINIDDNSLAKKIVMSLFYIFYNKKTKTLAITYFFFQFGFGLFVQSIALHLSLSYYYTPGQIGSFFVVMSFVMATSIYLLQRLTKTYISYLSQNKIGLISISFLLILGFIVRISVGAQQLIDVNYIWLITIMFYVLCPFVSLGFTNLFVNNRENGKLGVIIGGSGQVSSLAFCIAGLIMSNLLILSYNLILLISGLSFLLSYIVLKLHLQDN